MKRQLGIMASVLLLAGLAGMAAQAQEVRKSCAPPPYEAITTLQPPHVGIPTVWDATFEKPDRLTQLMSGLPLEGGTVMAVGRILSPSFAPESLVLAEINRRGRVLNEKIYPAKPSEMPVKIMPLKEGYLVLSNMRGGKAKDRRQVRLSWYDKTAVYKREKIIEDATYDYDGYDLIPDAEGDGFIVVAQAVGHKDDKEQHAVLVHFLADGKLQWQRAYQPGIPNQIYGASALPDKNYVTTGRIRLDDGRMGGWAMKLARDGAVLWQHTYPRGAFAVLRQNAFVPGKDAAHYGFVLLGEVTPNDGGPNAAWVMAVDGQAGDPLWQRYYRNPNTAFSPVGLMRADGGRFVATLNAKAMDKSGQRDHVRMLILSPQGAVIEDEAYINGVQAHAGDFVRGWNGERIIVSTIEVASKPLDIELQGGRLVMKEEEKKPDEKSDADRSIAELTGEETADKSSVPAKPDKVPPSLKGWIFIGTALDPYEDPCIRRRQ